MDLWQDRETLKVAIQTIDLCNNNCYMCPYGFMHHTKKQMSTEIFIKFISSLKQYMEHHSLDKIKFDFFLQNEPLLDKDLFTRIQYVKKNLKNAKIEVSSNGLLVSKYKQELLDNVDYHFYNIGGWDANSYNLSHKTNISQDAYLEMMEVINDIKSKYSEGLVIVSRFIKENVFDVNKPEYWYRRDYSRGGFLSNEKIYHTQVTKCHWNKNKFWNILADGTLILCYQDWRRQTVIGNINYQSLLEIENSKLYKMFMNKVEGGVESEEDFICKKCELSYGNSIYSKSDDFWVPRAYERK